VPRVEEGRVNARPDLELGFVVDRPEQTEDRGRVVLVVERGIEVDQELRRLRA
jgi:hypothetical protein